MYRNYLCRVCACTETTSVLVNIFEKHGAQDSVADILLELADIKVTVDDGFPQQCCLRCHTEVVQAVSLRRKCLESEKLFRIKIEPDSCPFSFADDPFDNQSDNLSIDSSNLVSEKHPMYHCRECSLDFFDSDALQKHYEAMHANVIYSSTVAMVSGIQYENLSDSNNQIYQCRECSLELLDSDALQEHYDTKHANVIYGWETIGLSEISPFDSTDDEPEPKDDILNCPSDVQTKANQNNPTLECCACKARFRTETDLFYHAKQVHAPNAIEINEPTPNRCNVCYQTFTTACVLKEHQKARSILNYMCVTCGMMFTRQHKCLAHESTHIDHKLKCDVCGKLFANMKYYEIHKNKMHGDQAARKRYICSICGAKVVSTSYLKVHMKLHSEDHPYSCDLCGARFKIVAYLNWHMTRHKGIYTCQQCGLTCKGPSELNEHMNSHGEARKYSCTICPSAFRLKQALEKHLRNVHKRKRK